jgi:putative acetyltransferase
MWVMFYFRRVFMYIRRMHDDEYNEVIKLITQTVHSVCKNDYSPKELQAWAPRDFDIKKFREALRDCINLVMIEKNKIVGFFSMEQSGYINRLYTHKDFLRRGIATELLKEAEKWAKENGVYQLSLDSSKTAQSFYIKNGFVESGVSVMEHGGVVFRNTVMKKTL